MDAISYPDPKVIALLDKYLAPVRVLINSKPLPQQFRVNWTPTLIVREARSIIGPSDSCRRGELLPSLLLVIAKSRFDHEQYAPA